MKVRFRFILWFAFVLFISWSGSAFAIFDLAKITIRVVDETGKTVEGARVGIGFADNSQRHETSVDGITNSEGLFSGSAKCNGNVGYNVTKSGYYMSIGEYSFNYEKKGIIRWEPWNPNVTIMLRKIENQVPMYARDTEVSTLIIPVTGKDVGFDLIAYDWVRPYGKGKVADLVCNLFVHDDGPTDYEYRVKINFPGQFNGIQSIEDDLLHGSEFKLPRFAPESGYNKGLTVFIDRKAIIKKSHKKNMNYIFRIRSEVEKGKLKRAMYGKILGDFDIGTKKDGNAFLQFKYYLNPDYTRNLEFDPKRNLFLNLPSLEQVRIK